MGKTIKKSDIVEYFCTRFLDYKLGQPPPSFITKKLEEYNYYPLEIVFDTIKQSESDIIYWINNKRFNSDYAKTSYIFAIIGSRIAEVFKTHERNERIKDREMLMQQGFTDPSLATGNQVKGKDISKFLEDGDVE